MSNNKSDMVSALFGKGKAARSVKLTSFAEEFIGMHLRDGLGVMTKKETEVLLMSLLERYCDLDGKSNHDLSLLLRISETRVAGLRYEAKLRYPPEEGYARLRLMNVIYLAEPEADGNRIQMIIENKYVRLYLNDLAKKKHSVIDTSFNREIVDIHWRKFAAIISEAFGTAIGKGFEEKLKKAKADQFEVTFAEAKKEFLKGLASGAGKAVPAVVVGGAKALLTGG